MTCTSVFVLRDVTDGGLLAYAYFLMLRFDCCSKVDGSFPMLSNTEVFASDDCFIALGGLPTVFVSCLDDYRE